MTGPRRSVQRPRDELGRLLPPGTADRYDPPQLDGLAVPDLAALGSLLLSEDRAFAAHEAFEEAWRLADVPGEAAAFRALAQLAAGACHAQRGNPSGARRLVERALRTLAGRTLPPGVPEALLARVAEGVLGEGREPAP